MLDALAELAGACMPFAPFAPFVDGGGGVESISDGDAGARSSWSRRTRFE